MEGTELVVAGGVGDDGGVAGGGDDGAAAKGGGEDGAFDLVFNVLKLCVMTHDYCIFCIDYF